MRSTPRVAVVSARFLGALGVLAALGVLGALGACSSPEERACERAAELYAQERAAGKAPVVGFSTDGRDDCLAKVKELKSGPRDCLSKCYAQARDVGGLFDCERACAVP